MKNILLTIVIFLSINICLSAQSNKESEQIKFLTKMNKALSEKLENSYCTIIYGDVLVFNQSVRDLLIADGVNPDVKNVRELSEVIINPKDFDLYVYNNVEMMRKNEKMRILYLSIGIKYIKVRAQAYGRFYSSSKFAL